MKRTILRITSLMVAIIIMTASITSCKPAKNSGVTSVNGESSSEAVDSNGSAISSIDGAGSSASNTSSGETGETSSESIEGTSSTINNNGTGASNLEGNVYLKGFPIVKNKETLTIMVAKELQHGDFDNMAFTREFEKITNIDIKWILVPSNTQFERKQTMFQSGNFPDIIALYPDIIKQQEIDKYGAEGAIISLGDKLQKWAPNAYEKIQPKEVMATIKRANGKIYSLPLIRNPEYRYWIINKKWLEDLGLVIPKTTEELYTVLKAFKTGDPNGNGLADEIPMGGFGWNPALFNSWGLGMKWYKTMVVDNNGKVEWGPATENFRRGVEFYKKLFNEGLIDKNLGSTSMDDHKKALKEGKVGISTWSWPYTAMSIGMAEQYVSMPIPTAKNNGNYPSAVSEYAPGISGSDFFITKACKNVPMALRVLDYFYTTEGYMLKMYGPVGLNYQIINGKYKILDSTKNYMTDAPSWVLGGFERISKSLMLEKSVASMTRYEKYVNKFTKDSDAIAAAQKPARYIPDLIYLPSEITVINKNMEALESYSYWNGINTITGTVVNDPNSTNIDVLANWSAHIAEMKKKGLDDVVKVYQAAYNRSTK